MEAFVEFGIIIGIATLAAILMKLLRQPLIISYIITGIIAGPYFLNILRSETTIAVFSQIGVSLLLFIVGLNLNPAVVKKTGKVSLVTGIGQIIFTSVIGFLILMALGFSVAASTYICVALTFSSTIIIMKLLSDKGETETLYGRIAIGFLIVQDIVAILILMGISSMHSSIGMVANTVWTTLGGMGLLASLVLVGFLFLPRVTKSIARSQELLLLFSIAWVLVFSSLFYYFNFSMEIGALLAGITLSLSPYRYEISSKMKPLRDFFVVLFFIYLGSQMVFADVTQYIIPIAILSAFVLIGNPLIVMALMGAMGYTRRTGFLAGLTVAQISEFSLILIALGVRLGHLPREILSLVTAIGLITIAGSTYMILYANRIYPRLSRYLAVFEKRGRKVDEHSHAMREEHDVILFGYNRIGYDLLEALRKISKRFLVVDYNPEVITDLARRGVNCKYGDANDIELLEELNLSKAKMIISTIPDFETNLLLLRKAKEANKSAIVIAVSHQIDEATALYDRGATYIIMPHFLGGYHASTMIERHGLSLAAFLKERASHMEKLRKRKMVGHEHPTHERHHQGR